MTMMILYCVLSFQQANTNPFDATRVNVEKKAAPTFDHVSDKGNNSTKIKLLASQLVSTAAKDTGVVLNSISSRRSIGREDGYEIIRIYMGYDAELEHLNQFFSYFEDIEFGASIETLNISRRKPSAKNKPDELPRKSLNGNVILCFTARDGNLTRAPEVLKSKYSMLWIRNLITNLGLDLPADTYLASIVVRKGEEVTIHGFSSTPERVLPVLQDYLVDVRPAKVTGVEDASGKTRFLYKGTYMFE